MNRKFSWGDPRIIYLIVATGVLIASLVPVSVTGRPLQFVVQAYDAIEALPDGGSVLWFDAMYGLTEKDTYPQCVVLMKHLLRKNMRIVLGSGAAASVPFMLRLCNEVFGPDFQNSLYYGKNIVYLSFVTGGAANLYQIDRSLREVHPVDYFNTPLNDIPMMQGLDVGIDWDLTIYSAGGGGAASYAEVFPTVFVIPYGTTFVAALTTEATSWVSKQLATGLMDGLIPGVRGSADYEALTGIPGLGSKYMIGTIVVAVMCIIGLVASNIDYWRNRLKKET